MTMKLFSGLTSVIAIAIPLVATTQLPAQTTANTRTMSVVDLINLPRIDDLRVSPTGTQVLFSKTDADWEENRMVSHLWRVDVDGTGAIQMTNGKDGEAGAVWSPDGDAIAFLAKRGNDDHKQIWVINNTGGEASRLSNHPTAVSSLSWSPDGATVYFMATDEKPEEEKARDEIGDNVFRFEEDKKNRHIWRIDVETGDTKRLTQGDFSVWEYDVSQDGGLIAYLRGPSPLLDDMPGAEVWLKTPNDTTEGRQITENTVFESGIQISQDNSQILFIANTDDNAEGFYFNNRLFVMPLEGGDPRCVVCGGSYDVNAARWSSDDSEIFFRANTGVRWDLYRVAPDTGEISSFTIGDHALLSWDYVPGPDLHAFSFSSPRDPGDIRVSRSSDPDFTRVTRVFDYVTDEFDLPEVRTVTWSGEDGVTVEGLLYLPMDYQNGKRYPLVVQTHGGPASSDVLRFPNSSDFETVLTAMGYVVFKPNYRGSTGYGDAFLRDMVGHYFNQAHKDVMTGVDHLIETGLVDGDRMAKMGWSAGGHMTNKIITYTDRFKAASSGAGAVNWISMYGQSDIRTYRTPWFGGDPWSENSPIDQYIADSPLFDVHKATTPTIILVGENDKRVPMPQSVELYRALKKNGVPTHLYVAPDQGHSWRELQHRLFKANVQLDWFERWVRGREYEWEEGAQLSE